MTTLLCDQNRHWICRYDDCKCDCHIQKHSWRIVPAIILMLIILFDLVFSISLLIAVTKLWITGERCAWGPVEGFGIELCRPLK